MLLTLCRHMSTYVDLCRLLMSTYVYYYVDYMSTYVYICLLYVDYVLGLYVDICICLLCHTYVDFTLYKSVQLCHISTTAAMVMDYKATPTESAPISSPTHTYQCRRLWKLDKLCNHGVIRCVVCREVYNRTAIPCVHNINEIEEALHRIGQTLE